MASCGSALLINFDIPFYAATVVKKENHRPSFPITDLVSRIISLPLMWKIMISEVRLSYLPGSLAS